MMQCMQMHDAIVAHQTSHANRSMHWKGEERLPDYTDTGV